MKMVLANREEEEREMGDRSSRRAGGLPKHAAGEDERERQRFRGEIG